jgi:Domain of unknown function (DUF5667)/Domain of unknown function (DUF5666)
MNDLYEALEICLQDIEQGADVETVLFRYPDLADELRPILEASVGAKSMTAPAPSTEVVRRNRAKVLQHAARMREAKAKSSQRLWFASLRRIAVSLAVVTLLFVSGTSLVGASSNTLPGDNLYPVKRTWEGVRLFFTFNGQEREALELAHENERLEELNELLQEGRSEAVDFNGLLTSQNGNEWIVAGVRVLISSQTDIHDQGIAVGSPVRVRGITQGNGAVLAERIQLLSANAIVPKVAEEHESEEGNGNNSGPGSGTEGPKVEETATPEPENENSGSNSGSNENLNENSNENENSNLNENSGSEIENNNQNGNENSGQESNNNENEHENENNSGGGENNSSGGGESGGEE